MHVRKFRERTFLSNQIESIIRGGFIEVTGSQCIEGRIFTDGGVYLKFTPEVPKKFDIVI